LPLVEAGISAPVISKAGQAGSECFNKHWTTGLFLFPALNTAEQYVKYRYVTEDY
jgi:hypothetical protein